jgi:hypothetical protein
MTTNLTLTVDSDILRRARVQALEQGTSVNALVRQFLARLAGRSRPADGISEFFAAVRGTGAASGPVGRTWSRDDIYG